MDHGPLRWSTGDGTTATTHVDLHECLLPDSNDSSAYRVDGPSLGQRWPQTLLTMLAVAGITIMLFASPNTTTPSLPSTRLEVDVLLSAQTSANFNVDQDDVPNSSRGPSVAPPTFEKIMAAIDDVNYNQGLLPIPLGSPYGISGDLLNPGQPNVVVALGDSHLDFTKPRFVKLFQDASNASTFPTMVFKVAMGTSVLQCAHNFVANLDMILRVKPQVAFVSFYWWTYIRPDGAATDLLHHPLPCCSNYWHQPCQFQSQRDAVELVRNFQAHMTRLTAAGIRVFVAGVNVDGMEYHPSNMVSGGDVGVVDPVSRAAFEAKRAFIIGLVEPAVAAAGATLINFSDNMCDGDICQVVDPDGVPIMKDDNHFTASFVRTYLSVVDQVAAAGMAPLE
ncbi:Aste57867_8474 [Aphanomyces stellatus]|uniref:Aste57867_8474 protein n=1 Tax=Aphanomyces stellatus TaxID=120398 RepID=A0A485KKF9_9STRA|nr:hypothetical protein As57867_008442 [Aphanomyces stellatus]VFT85360.1 Aste57867_8474 [Aphanomyces stellatus]